MPRAASSFPVPVSPVMSTVPGAAAARWIRSLTFAIARLSPTSASSEEIGRNLPLQQIDLACELAPIGGRSDAHQQLVTEERLLHEVHRAELHRLDRRIDRPEARHHDERRVHANVAELAQHVDAREPRHPHVGQDDVEAVALRQLESFFAGRDHLHGVPRGAQHPARALAHARIVVDEKDARHESR